MTSLESTTQVPLSLRLPFRLERAELLKLRKNRSVWTPAALLTIGAMVIMYGTVELFHVFNSDGVGPAGGTTNFGDAVFLMGELAATISAILVGATVATQDMSSGTLRDLASTGRSRSRLYLARLVGGLTLLVPLVVAAYAVAAVSCVLFASGLPTPSATLFIKGGLWVLLSTAITYLIAFGLGSFTGSRAATISILIAYLLPVQGILHRISVLGQARDGLLSVAIAGLSPFPPANPREMILVSHTTSLIVLAAWVGIFSSLGLWKMRTRDA
jgi:ABC-type transport system involved in multi-copper enzyme maturation permease subunit